MNVKSIQRNPNLTGEHEAWFWAGVEVGIRQFAHGNRGEQRVGVQGTRLYKAIRDMDAEASVECWHPSKTFNMLDDCHYCTRCGLQVASA